MGVAGKRDAKSGRKSETARSKGERGATRDGCYAKQNSDPRKHWSREDAVMMMDG
jgi:hypothetical protein